MDKIKERVSTLIDLIVAACRLCGLNLTVCEGGIGLVDQEQRKIVAVWHPQYTAEDIPEGTE